MGKIAKKCIITALIIALFFLSSCQPVTEKTETAGTPETTEVSVDGCTPQWECADENYKVYVSDDCTRKDATKCERGCADGECRPADVCTTGFKCIDDFRRGYQKEDCSFISKKDCEWGCDLGKCQEKPTNIFENASEAPKAEPEYSAIAENQEDEEVDPERIIYTLKVGEQQEINNNGFKANLSIHFLEPSQVTIKVNGIKSSPVPEQGNFTYENLDTTFYIEWILFQSFAGGKQEIGYSID